ncbi:MAG: RnfABCDGE type electron transport complex subunit G [Anaerosomatales bacterium]|nr:RnfABCDGE type electron transport complex subunit G [Anaerosomatales bacterium]
MSSSSARLVISVAVTCVVAAGGLAATYSVTAPRIAAQERDAEQRALKRVLPEAARFEALDEKSVAEAAASVTAGEVEAVWKAVDASGSDAGWCIKTSARGYGGPVRMVIGLDRNGKVSGLTILAMNETPGLGTRVESEPWFMRQFLDLPPGYGERDVKQMDAISGATRSSKAVKNCVTAAGQAFAALSSGKAVSQ